MHSLVNANFNRTYNPQGRQNVLSDIKRLLTSRDTESQKKASGYLIEAISKYNFNSNERTRLIEYLLDNDIIVFLCEATSNLEYPLFRSILQCIRLLWRTKRFFEEHSTHALSAIIRCLVHYSAIDTINAVETCLHFICDLLIGIKEYETTSALSQQSAYNTEQLLGAFQTLSTYINNKPNTLLCSTFVLHALISYQPVSLDLRGNITVMLAEVLDKWLDMLASAMSRIILVGVNGDVGSMLHVTCQLGVNALRLTNIIEKPKTPSGLVQQIITDEQEIATLKEAAFKMRFSTHKLIKELVILTKDHQNVITTGDYGIFLRFLFNFMYENAKTEIITDFCDFLFSNGYLITLPQIQITRDDPVVRKLSSLVLGEMLKTLTAKYLYIEGNDSNTICNKDIEIDLLDIQYSIEMKQNISVLLQKNQAYSFLIYAYFYCQSSENPQESTSFLLPYLVDYLLRMPKNFKLPCHIVKALWLVFAMSSISNGSVHSLQERVLLEKAVDRLVILLCSEPSKYYTHNPVILFWSFTSLRIPNLLKLQVLSEWFKIENNLPTELTKEPIIWEILLNIIIQSKDSTIVTNCIETLRNSIENAEESSRNDFALIIWSLLPSILSRTLIEHDDSLVNTNVSHILDIAIKQIPSELDQISCIKVAVLITTLFSKNTPHSSKEYRNHFDFVCLELCLLLLEVSRNYDDNKVLLTYTNRAEFLPNVLTATNSSDDRVACAALKLLSQVVYCFAKYKYNPKSILQMKTDLIINSLRDDDNERGSLLLQLIYIVLNSNNTPLVLTFDSDIVDNNRQWNVLRALMFRIQMMLCCRDSENQCQGGWKALSAIFKHAISYKNDPNLVATLTSQPWTYILIEYQLTLRITPEFLTFTQNWLIFLKITLRKAREITKIHISKDSRIVKTAILLKNGLANNELEASNKVIAVANDILDECNCEN